jgi:hypothetical protein
MKFGIDFQLQTPRPLDADQWHEHDELNTYHQALEQIECADKLGYDSVFITEVWHRILKSGGRIEARQLAVRERVQRCLTLYRIIAWRVCYATMPARAVPRCRVTCCWRSRHGRRCMVIHHCPTPPEEPPTLEQAVRWMAQLGGFVGRQRSDHPGTETLWRGFQHLSDLTRMYCIMRAAPP